MSLADAQYLDGRKFSRTEVCGLFRVPPHLIGDLDGATFSNIEQQGLEFVLYGLMPALRRCEQRIWLQLLTEPEKTTFFAKFNERALLRGDMASRGAFYQVMRNINAMSPNEIRDAEDMNPYEGGDDYDAPMASNTPAKDPVVPPPDKTGKPKP
jgi:HK97 family phage portal protein